ncbi:hypothetical protein [Motilimonas cestriensis]|uniref:hypothetical protein n=1 Tax=Motilimonas cestriensis TaxID=2742685 RepID=UPI003DA4CBF0
MTTLTTAQMMPLQQYPVYLGVDIPHLVALSSNQLLPKQAWPVVLGIIPPPPSIGLRPPNVGMSINLVCAAPIACEKITNLAGQRRQLGRNTKLPQMRHDLATSKAVMAYLTKGLNRSETRLSTRRGSDKSGRFQVGYANGFLSDSSTQLAWFKGQLVDKAEYFSYLAGRPIHSDNRFSYHRYQQQQSNWHLLNLKTSAVNSPFVMSYGPKPAAYICSDKYRPKRGLVTLASMAALTPNLWPVVLNATPDPSVCYWDEGGGLIDAHPTLPDIDFNLPIGPQIRTSYLMQPTFDCVRVSDGQRIMLESASISRSRGNYAAQVSLGFQSRIDAQRARNQALKISINGYDFYCLAEQFSDSWQFNSASHSASGRSLLAQLSGPYVLPSSYTNGVSRSFAGVLGDILQNTSWRAEIAFTDFVLPAGSVSLTDKTPAEMVNALAAELGCMCVCDDAKKLITVMPKWPTVPWLIGSAVQDITLHDGVIYSLSSQEQISPACNSVFVRGEQNGVSRQIKRTGTAGNINAGDIASALIVDDMAARLCGTMALAETGAKVAWSLTCPVMQDLPPLIPGQLIAVTADAITFKGVCDSMSISASIDNDGGISVEQSINLIEPITE